MRLHTSTTLTFMTFIWLPSDGKNGSFYWLRPLNLVQQVVFHLSRIKYKCFVFKSQISKLVYLRELWYSEKIKKCARASDTKWVNRSLRQLFFFTDLFKIVHDRSINATYFGKWVVVHISCQKKDFSTWKSGPGCVSRSQSTSVVYQLTVVISNVESCKKKDSVVVIHNKAVVFSSHMLNC